VLADVPGGAEQALVESGEVGIELYLECLATFLFIDRKRIECWRQPAIPVLTEAALDDLTHASRGRQEGIEVRVEGALPIMTDDPT